ncbi:putative globular PEP-CTERM protein [Geminisphaera colitermitum]|uniref:putative globular PEP-CTERM protein n=1 Tax=Geminisphaera colitermitum TaxID=1148786 RepID=UPI0012FF568A|nr:putative globular PEP-CTERM protein [Geminisphaera colitermitum]
MKKIMIGAGAALVLSFQAQAVPLGFGIDGAVNLIKDEAGSLLSAYDGYIVTFWYGSSAGSTLTIAHSAMNIADSEFGEETKGLFNTAAFYVDGLTKGDPLYMEARIFQYTVGETIDLSYVENLNAEDFTKLAEYWDLIQGTQVSQGALTFTGQLDPDGLATNVTFGPAEYLLNGVKDTPAPSGAVPEPSTYAVLAGLTIMVYVIVRRRR